MQQCRIQRLRRLHRQLDDLIRDEQRRANPDALILQDLKRRRLELKDELHLAEAGLAPVTLRIGRA
ncbi:YdcH family protein [Phenylobacterium sp. J367]|uniref:YdcH family protein n=1 Tax=Phenylobacterium sp. J367 TaxID=2898435 RepID=UPI0021516DA2|nr:YdcH family protein [Phenylobacterium sp. J367]MCR5879330.1 YdcH family protein [Phenylobacterium sp. J367]